MTDKTDRIAAITTAITRGGGIVKFSDAIGVSHQAIYAWRKRGCVPLDKATAIEAMFGVPRADMLAPEVAALLAPPASDADVI